MHLIPLPTDNQSSSEGDTAAVIRTRRRTRNAGQGDFICVAWYEQYGVGECACGEAEVLFSARNTLFEGLQHAGVLAGGKGEIKPVIAAVNGMAVGGGFELALSCNLILASSAATSAYPKIRAGTLADAATIKLPKRMPFHIAMKLLFTDRWMDAAEGRRRGVVNEVPEPCRAACSR